VKPPGPAFGRPDNKLRATHQFRLATMMGFAKRSTHLLAPALSPDDALEIAMRGEDKEDKAAS
jgi:hypothetical protein